MTALTGTNLEVFPLCLGGNVFGWTLDERQTFEVLDAYAAAGGNFIDTADGYCFWVEGNEGGESEDLIGRWLSARRNRDDFVIATKVGQKPDRLGLSAANVRAAADESLQRLRTNYIDVYLAHIDDPSVPLEETLGAFAALVREGKVRNVGASNFTAPRLAEALGISNREDFPRFSVLQPHYNLINREYEQELGPLCAREGLGCIPYLGLAGGFLTGKYRPGSDYVDSPRAEQARGHLDGHGSAVLEVLDEVAAARGVPIATVALAWLAGQPTVSAPIASARTPEQLADLLPMASLELTQDEIRRLSDASA